MKEWSKRGMIIFIGILFLVLTGPSMIYADVPQTIHYQGKLTDTAGTPVPDGDRTMVFRIYDAPVAGSLLWTETQTVTIGNGVYNVELGLFTPFPPGLFYGPLYLAVEVDGEKLDPRQALTSTPFAMTSELAQFAEDSDKLDSLDSTDFAFSGHSHKFSDLDGSATDAQIPNDITIDSAAHAGSADTALQAKNAELLDSLDSSYFAPLAHTHDAGDIVSGTLSKDRFSAHNDLSAEGYLGNASGDIAQNNSTLQTNLNSDMLDGQHAANFASSSHHHDSLYVNVTGDSMSSAGSSATLSVSNSGTGDGIYISDAGDDGLYVYGAGNDGIYVDNPGDDGLQIYNSGNDGIFIQNAGDDGIQIHSAARHGIIAYGGSDTGEYGGYFYGDSGVYGYSSETTETSYAVRGYLNNHHGYAIYGENGKGCGVYGKHTDPSYTAPAVYGENTGSGLGVYGKAQDGDGIKGEAIGVDDYDTGVKGEASYSGDVTNYGGYFTAAGSTGKAIYAYASNAGDYRNYGGYFWASGTYGRGIYAYGQEYAGYFYGDVKITGRVRDGLEIDGNLEIYTSDGATKVLELGTGLDYAEGFDVAQRDSCRVKPGDVLVIDPDNPGKLALSQLAYDTKVAGIVAGANSLGSGVRLGAGQFDHDVALAGRVYCNVDTTQSGIEPGDLLTTSPVPGYAMKASDYLRAQGAIIGKAMQKLEKGQKGQILVLVTLQ